MNGATLRAHVDGVGLLGPGMTSWTDAVHVLSGEVPWVPAPTVMPAPQSLPAAERRRTGPSVKLTLATGLEATRHAGVAPELLPAVFTSSGGDGQNCHEICAALATSERQISPTRFHNSVHNAAAGYWGIATGATPASTALCAHDASFGAGLLEALTQVIAERTAVLLLAYDSAYPEPINGVRSIPDAFGVALVLAPARGPATLAQIEAHLSDATADPMAGPLEGLRRSIPAARSLPLLARLASASGGSVVLDYLPHVRLAVSVTRCR
jgi:Beta-ketoacyl synthase, N-terminal domain